MKHGLGLMVDVTLNLILVVLAAALSVVATPLLVLMFGIPWAFRQFFETTFTPTPPAVPNHHKPLLEKLGVDESALAQFRGDQDMEAWQREQAERNK